MDEIWKDIKGYEGIYQISTLGNIKSSPRKGTKGGLLNASEDKDGYLCIGLNKNGKRKTFKVHRLVAMTFIPNIFDLQEVNHKDENPSNNHVENLEWCTNEYNVRYGTAIMRIRKTQLKRAKAVLQLDKDGNVLGKFLSLERAAEAMGCCTQLIQRVCNNKPHCYTAKGYRWQWA
jgi:hypothetical protein